MDLMFWLRIVFALILFGGTWVGFAILFCGLVDEETRCQARKVRASVRAARKKASEARKKAWAARRDFLFREMSRCPSPGNSLAISAHLAAKP